MEKEIENIKELIKKAMEKNKKINYKNLSDADLSGLSLYGIDLNNARMECTNLTGANLECASLIHANLKYANLKGANLRCADLIESNLMGANLKGANLRCADLRNVVGNGKEIKSMQLERYNIAFTKDVLQIGCRNHPIKIWKNFTDKEIEKMDKGALKWWKKYKEFIFKAIELSKEEL